MLLLNYNVNVAVTTVGQLLTAVARYIPKNVGWGGNNRSPKNNSCVRVPPPNVPREKQADDAPRKPSEGGGREESGNSRPRIIS